MTLTKKQVMNILKVLKKSRNRPAIKNMSVQKHANGKYYLTCTDSYTAVYMPLNDHEDMKVGIVPFEKIEVWYKLASTKDLIDTQWIVDNLEENNINYPNLEQALVKGTESLERIAFNAELLNGLQLILGVQSVELEFGGTYKPINVTSPETEAFAILLPVRLHNQK